MALVRLHQKKELKVTETFLKNYLITYILGILSVRNTEKNMI